MLYVSPKARLTQMVSSFILVNKKLAQISTKEGNMNRKLGLILVSAVSITLLMIILVISLFFIVPKTQAKQLILYSFTVGQKLSQRVTMEQKINMTIMGQQQTVDQVIGIEYNYEIVKVRSDNSAELKCTYTWVLFKQDGPNGSIEYESSVSEQSVDFSDKDAMGKVYGALVGESFITVISSDGQVIAVEGVSDIYSHLVDKIVIPDNLEVDRDQLLKSIQSQFGEDAIKEMMANSFTPYSQHPVGIGDTWNHTLKLSTGFPMIVETTYKLIERNGDTSTIKLESTISHNPDGKPLQSGLMTISYKMQGNQEGTVVVDATGWAVNGKLVQSFSGTMVMEGEGLNLSVPMSVESTVLVETKQ
jgi:hypothetical protein